MDINTVRGLMSNDWLPVLWAGFALGSCMTLVLDLQS
jgi:hypothetical protein